MARNYGVHNEEEILNPESFTAGFWAGAIASSALWVLGIAIGLFAVGLIV